jgi:hypothetical protein
MDNKMANLSLSETTLASIPSEILPAELEYGARLGKGQYGNLQNLPTVFCVTCGILIVVDRHCIPWKVPWCSGRH